MAFAYVVRAVIEDERARDAFAAWLVSPHVADVCAAGAEDAEIVRIDGLSAIEVRYRFASREAFAAYERDHAPRLRADGIAALGGAQATFVRTTGEILPWRAPRVA
jgi:hypothetical protein